MTILVPSLDGPSGPFAPPRPAMRGRYLIRNPLKARAMTLLDVALSGLPTRRAAPSSMPRRILVADWGHLGDVITTFGAIATLRQRFPQARIDMIVGSWGRAAIATTGLVDTLHIVDHWAVNRSDASLGEKYRRYRETRAAALRDMHGIGYDLAIDFYPFFPPAHPLFHRLSIPLRIGFDSGGFGPLLTHAVPWPDRAEPMAEQYRDLLAAIAPTLAASEIRMRPVRDRAALASRPDRLAGVDRYVVLHPGAGAAYKDWGVQHWHSLIVLLASRYPDLEIVLTGAGAAEKAMTTELARAFPQAIDLAGRVDWDGFVSTIAYAAIVVCPDTATGHVAALFNTPVVSIFTGTNNWSQWSPYSDAARVVSHPVLCAPCNRAGCEAMACIRSVTPDRVAEAVAQLLPTSSLHSSKAEIPR